MNINRKKKYFHCYATANDDRFYYKDIQNLMRIRNTPSGFDNVCLYIAISEVNKTNKIDRIFVWAVKNLFNRHPKITLKKVFFKTNVGRDFSSYSCLYDCIKEEAALEEYIFFQNRSGYGPFRKGWLQEMILQFEKFRSIALCGSTINFKDHPKRSQRNNLPHVQTYAFLTKISFLKKFQNSFPGKEEKSRLNIIINGEIGLSQFFIKRGYGITCMEWPNQCITNETKPIADSDIKNSVTQQHQFYHKFYDDKFLDVRLSQKMYLFLRFLIKSLLVKYLDKNGSVLFPKKVLK